MKTCPDCGCEFDSSNIRKIYCCKRCYQNSKAKRNYARNGSCYSKNKGECSFCSSNFSPTHKNQKYCSSECSANARKKYLSIPQCLAEASRKLDKHIGYIRVYCPDHPCANTWGYVYEHRLIVEGILGRILDKKEHVHHINGQRWDNRPENLQVLSASEHSKIKK